MRLSRLHITGFKSFPDRAELGFDTGVTAIVGPNGCGKSNVVDAITWVLGEQSAKSLRGERMEDVIFNGSDARKPTAAAEVRLKLTEVAQAAMAAAVAMIDLDPLLDEQPLVTRDVEIGRRLYRSGESEYLIDGEVCRLRDVHDLLMDSGLGVKAYAVIEQGKIGQILASRPAERRTLIEEAAGVTKYKVRRHAAELKLKAAEQNLTRIDDIIFEVEKQRMALRRQAARARRYRRLREELRRWEQVQFAHHHEALSRDIEAADAELAEIRAREAAASARVAEVESALEGARLRLTEAEAGATSSRESAHARELDIGRRQQQIEFDKRQIEQLERQALQLAEEAADLEGRQGPAREAAAGQREAENRARTELDAVERQVGSAEADYRSALGAVQAAETEADATRAVALGSATTLSALRQARDNAAAVRDRVAVERERLDLEQRELEGKTERAGIERRAAEGALREARAELETTRLRRTRVDEEVSGLQAERTGLTGELAERRQALAAAEARLRSLEQIVAGRTSFGDAARFLLTGDDRSIETDGALADHVEVEPSFERAVDALLGGLLQHVVVGRGEDVTRALAVLEREQAGRCGFVVLDELMRAEPAAGGWDAPAGVRALSSVVRTTGPVAGVGDRLFGDAFIAATFDAARELSRTTGAPVAAPTGEVFRRGWRVEGGGGDEVRGILETRAEVGSLRDQVDRDGGEVERVAGELRTVDAALPDAERRQTEAVRDVHECEKGIVGLEARMGRAIDEVDRVAGRLDVVQTERRRTEEEEQATTMRRDEASAAITDCEARRQTAEASLDVVLATLQAAREGAESRLHVVTEARTAKAALVERSAALEAEVGRLEEAARDLEQRLETCRRDIEKTETRRGELRVSITETEQLLDTDVGHLGGLQQEVRGLDERVVALRDEVTERDQDMRAARLVLEGVRGELMQSEVKRATAASDLAHLGATCADAIGIPLEEVVREVARMEDAGELVAPARRVAAVSKPDEDEDPESTVDADQPFSAPGEDEAADMTAEEVIADLKQKIERLGPVNMMAIEQFDELETRHEFLTTQRKDLLDSIEQTGEAIRKIDKTTRERFAGAFTSINAHFQNTFATLFGGGRAGLVLIDQEHDPESGVDIIAQPPGKRLQNVQLLSGGEKALTAMALMFAIFKHRPSPFCLLDEIDAPLDDANIGRFVEMLQGMQGHTQFILVTHNRKTMEIANRLYGVTMEEPGVSKLISIQLN